MWLPKWFLLPKWRLSMWHHQTANRLLFSGLYLPKISCRFKPRVLVNLTKVSNPGTFRCSVTCHQHFLISCAFLKREGAKKCTLCPFNLWWLNSDVSIYTACAPTRSLSSDSFAATLSLCNPRSFLQTSYTQPPPSLSSLLSSPLMQFLR